MSLYNIMTISHLVLDLDETLIKSYTEKPRTYDFTFVIDKQRFWVKKRPDLDKFLQFAFKTFKSVNIWTAATGSYAKLILCHILLKKQLPLRKIKFVYTRTNLTYNQSGDFYKDLRKIFNNDITPNNTIMLDDRIDVLVMTPNNALIIAPYKGDKYDTYLLQAANVLSHLNTVRVARKGPLYL